LSYLHSMNGFLLLRHARASWPQPGHTDFDRPLAETGRGDAIRLAAIMTRHELIPDYATCSPARRAVETLEQLRTQFPDLPVNFVPELYEGDANAYLALIRSLENFRNPLIIGHNPMLEDLALALSENHVRHALEQLQTGFPTCGLAVFDVDGELSDARADTVRLSQFIAPQMA
jgi:phosphohistidine phosphatase